jgi:predicted permease
MAIFLGLSADLRWAARGLRARGWSGALSVALLSAAMAVSTLVFSSTDALIFNRVPYPEADRLVTPRTSGSRSGFEVLREQKDIFAGVAGDQPSATFLDAGGGPEQIRTMFVTPGLFETLGVLPEVGRPLVDADRASIAPTFAVIGADLARRHFGTSAAAIGATLATPDRPLTVVGVMPAGFRYPDGRAQIWRALDFERLQPTFPNMNLIARLRPGLTPADAGARLGARLPMLLAKGRTAIELAPAFGAASDERTTTLTVLLGAALCLLLAACANVANLEFAGGLRRARTFSVQMALGASRASLVRIALFEGALLTAAAVVVAAMLAAAGAPVLTSVLPETITLGGVNPIDVDWRALAFLVAIAAGVWLLASLPVVLFASRSRVLSVLKVDDRGAGVSRVASLLRRTITAVEVALAVMLLTGSLLYLRTYAGLLGVDTGLDARGVASLAVTFPEGPIAAADVAPIALRLAEALSSAPGVVAVSRITGAAPPGNAFSMASRPEAVGRPRPETAVTVTAYSVDPAFFATVNLRPIHGRTFDAADPPAVAVVSETFARYLWGDESPIGSAFRLDTGFPWTTVVGVVPHVRTNRDDLAGPSARAFSYFQPSAPRAAAAPAAPRPPAPVVNAPTGRLPYFTATFLVRLSDPSRLEELPGLARAVEPRAGYAVTSLAAAYAARHAETRMATAIVTAFAVVAFGIAVAGVFGVITFLVQGRTREIGIRMALGAGRQDVRGMVLGTSLQLVLAGVVLGIGGAIAASRLIASQLFGVSPTDPLTYAGVSLAVIAATVLAAWHPAHRAARVEPAVTLRAE